VKTVRDSGERRAVTADEAMKLIFRSGHARSTLELAKKTLRNECRQRKNPSQTPDYLRVLTTNLDWGIVGTHLARKRENKC